MRVTIVLTTGAFFPKDDKDQTYFDVGYFETPGRSDIEVSEDGNMVQPQIARKIGRGNVRIEVEHVEKDGITVKEPVNPSASFDRDIMKKDDLYGPNEIPAFIKAAYDCIMRFHSGDFSSADVKPRRFTEHLISDDRQQADKMTRAIANEIHVDYDLAAGETLRLQGPGAKEVWSITPDGSGTKNVVVKILTDDSLNLQYHKRALDHKAQHYYVPNSDPPPMDGPLGRLVLKTLERGANELRWR